MPYYDYKNAETGEKTSIFMTIAEMEKRSKADMSIVLEGVRWERDLASEIDTTNMGGCAVWPMKSDAAGVHPTQVGDFRKDSEQKGVPTDFDPKTGQAIFKSRSHRARYLKTYNMHDRNGGYSDG
jgi:hypothetical protein|tara:strand:+ start:270 stop:644 length:375 start_codon:yes stop_codon:yes gene_type:complete